MQELQVDATAGETLAGAEHWQGYGLTVHPRPGAEALLLGAGGSRARPVVLACADRRYRVTGLAEGEVCLHDDQGQKLTLYRDRVEVVTGGSTVTVRPSGCTITSAAITLAGPVTVTGSLTVQGAAALGGGGSVTGDLTVSGTVRGAEVIATTRNVTLGTHKHAGVTAGGAQTQQPVTGT
jgi:phage baseplate assembly protein V